HHPKLHVPLPGRRPLVGEQQGRPDRGEHDEHRGDHAHTDGRRVEDSGHDGPPHIAARAKAHAGLTARYDYAAARSARGGGPRLRNAAGKADSSVLLGVRRGRPVAAGAGASGSPRTAATPATIVVQAVSSLVSSQATTADAISAAGSCPSAPQNSSWSTE